MNYREEALAIACGDDTLVGVLARPDDACHTGVLIIVGGPQTRVGSHRQFVLLSRTLAAEGFFTLRFDYRGMGDSTGTPRNFERIDDDIRTAIDALMAACPRLQRVVLWGLCDAASAALKYWDATRDPRIGGFCLLNPWVRSETTHARTQVKHYYRQRLADPQFWRKLVTGKLALLRSTVDFAGSLAGSLRRTPKPVGAGRSYQEAMAHACAEYPGNILLVLSGNDYTAKEFLEFATTSPVMSAALNRPAIARHDLAEADHTFASAAWRRAVEQATLQYLRRVAPDPVT